MLELLIIFPVIWFIFYFNKPSPRCFVLTGIIIIVKTIPIVEITGRIQK